MKRLVYSPSVGVWLQTDTGVFDLSPYVTDFSIDRRVNEVSQATVTFRNPRITDERNPNRTRFMFTEHIANDGTVRPMFHPMDSIIITLTRLKGRPIQVFTGFCDTTPYVQLMPGTATLTASCTLKKLQYTYWDPALPFVRDFMLANGWGITDSGIALNASVEEGSRKVQDSSIGFLLYNVLKEIGGWSESNIYIQGLPRSIEAIVRSLYRDTTRENVKANKDFYKFLSDTIGASSYGSIGTDATGGDPGDGTSDGTLDEGGSVGTRPKLASNAPEWLRKLVDEADRIANSLTYYSHKGHWGDNKKYLSNPPVDNNYLLFDCSSFCSYMMHYVGKLDTMYASWDFANWGSSGPGKYVTVWYNNSHVLLEIKQENGSSKYISTSGHIQSLNPNPRSPGSNQAESDGGPSPHDHTVGWLDGYDLGAFSARHFEQ